MLIGRSAGNSCLFLKYDCWVLSSFSGLFSDGNLSHHGMVHPRWVGYESVMSDWRNLRVEKAGFTPRTRGALMNDQRFWNCHVDDWRPLLTMGDVAGLSDRELMGRPRFGPKALVEVRGWFERHGVRR